MPRSEKKITIELEVEVTAIFSYTNKTHGDDGEYPAEIYPERLFTVGGGDLSFLLDDDDARQHVIDMISDH